MGRGPGGRGRGEERGRGEIERWKLQTTKEYLEVERQRGQESVINVRSISTTKKKMGSNEQLI